MRVALVRQRYTPYGGAERFVERALEALGREAVDLTLICREWTGTPAHRVLACRPFHVGRLWRDWSFSRCVARTIARERFDLVQSHERIPGCELYRAGDGVHATWLECRARIQSTAARLATRANPWHRYTLAQEARMFRHPGLQAVICNSQMVREDIARRFGVPQERLHLVRNGVDLEAFHPRLREAHRRPVRERLGLPQDAPVFLYVGAGFERKGVPALLRAFERVRHREALLLLVGRDRRQAQLEAGVRHLGPRVRFLGAQQDVRPYYGAADACVLPTLYDPFPNVALEALASGLPLLTSTSCGAAELIREGENGHVCDALDVAALAQRIEALAAPGAAAAMGAAARASVSALSSADMARRLVALYRMLLGRAGRGGPL